MADFTERDVEKLIELFTKSDLTVLRVTTASTELLLSRQSESPPPAPAAAPTASPAVPASAPAPATGPATGPGPDPASPPAARATGATVTAPVLGAFYHAPRPGQPPYVTVGSKVEPGTTVGLIEAMKVYTAVPAGVTGTVVEILVPDNEFVEYGQPLMVIEPDPVAAG